MLLFQILKFAQLESDEERIKVGKEIYDMYIMRELLSLSHVSRVIHHIIRAVERLIFLIALIARLIISMAR